MERLTPEQEQQIHDFTDALSRVDGPDDLFRPDMGVREPAPKPRPFLPPLEAIAACVAYVSPRELGQYALSRA